MSIYSRYHKALSHRASIELPDRAVTPFVQNKIIRHEANTLGLDFIVGDLHGCVEHLRAILRHVGFNESADRLFSVGDLVDRGPDSPGSLELLKQSWFYPVMGNHDAMLLAVLMEYAGSSANASAGALLLPELSAVDRVCAEVCASAFFGNGGKWLRSFLRDETPSGFVTEWLTLLQGMPLIRVIGSGSDRFHVVHAELLGDDTLGRGHPGWCDLTLDQPDAEDNPLWEHPHNIWGFDMVGDGVDHVMWGRELRARVSALQGVTEDDVPDMRGLSRTYVGHTITVMQDGSQLMTAGSHVFLDTGAYKSVPNDKGVYDLNHGLTIWCHQEDRGWKYNGVEMVDMRMVY
ncbi:MAG: metallophosphoesterase [Acidithiobacillus sp.]